MVSRVSKVDSFANSLFFFLLIIIRSGLLAEIKWSMCMSKSHRSYYYYYSLIRGFHISVCRWFFTGVWVTASLLSRTLLSIRVDLNNTLLWMVSIRPLVSKSSSPFNNPLLAVPRAPITIGINVTFIFHNFFFNSLARSRYLSFFSFSLLLFTPLEFFISVLADGLSLEFEWQQVSSSLQDSSQYSGRSQQCCRLDSLYPSANFQILQAL